SGGTHRAANDDIAVNGSGVESYPVADLVLPVAVNAGLNPFQVDDSRVPALDEPPTVYPSEEQWRLLTKDRGKYKSVQLKKFGVATAQIINALKEPTEMDFVETPLKDVVEAMKIRHGIEMQLDRKAISDAGGS